MLNWREGDVDSSGINVHYYRTGVGDKPSLVLAHGFTDNGLCWIRCAEQLESAFDVVMVDARNHGKSGQGSAHQEELAADMAAVIVALKLAPALVMGHSVGGSVVTALAAYHPELVSGLVLEDPPWMMPRADTRIEENSDSSKRSTRAQAFREHVESLALQTRNEIMDAGKREHPSWHTDEFWPWATSNLQVQAEAMARLELEDWVDMIPLVQCPALLVFGDKDKGGIVSAQCAAAVQTLNPMVTTQHVAGGGHNLRREAFVGFMEAVTPFLVSNREL